MMAMLPHHNMIQQRVIEMSPVHRYGRSNHVCSDKVNKQQLIIQVVRLSQRNRAAGWVSFGQKWKTGTGRQYFADIIGQSSITVT